MRVAVVSFPLGRPDPGGPEPPVRALADALVDLGHQVKLLGGGRGDHADRRRAGPMRGESTGLENVGSYVRQLSRELEAGDYDVLHSHGWLAGLTGVLAARAGQVPLVHTYLDQPRVGAPVTELRAERLCAAHAAHLVVTSGDECEALVRAGIPRRRVSVVPRGLDVIEPPAGTPFPPATGHRIVVFGGQSRVAELIRMLKAVPGADLVLAVTPEHPLDEGEVCALAGRLGLGDRVTVEHVATPLSRMSLMRSAVAVVCMANADPGTAHLEAMMMGVPVVAGNAVAAEAVVDGITGFHARENEPRQLAGSLRTLLNDPIRREGMGMAGRDRALMRYSWTRVAGEIAQIYRRVAPARTVMSGDAVLSGFATGEVPRRRARPPLRR